MNYIAFDLETTGTDADYHRIIEIGAVRFENFKPVATFNELVDPKTAIPPDAQRVNGISQDMVAGKPEIKAVLGPFADFCKDLPLVAHNARFDYKFLLTSVKMHEAPAPSGRVIDTFAMSKKVVPGLHNYKLETLIRHFGVNAGTLHRASEDAGCCGEVFAHMVQGIDRGGHPTDVDSLIALTGLKDMTFPQYSRAEQLGLF